MAKPQYGNQHQRDREIALSMLVPGTPCHYCLRPMYVWQRLDLDHLIPVVNGGANGPKRLAHSRCNRSNGASIGNRIRAIRNRNASGNGGDRASNGRGGRSRIRRRIPRW